MSDQTQPGAAARGQDVCVPSLNTKGRINSVETCGTVDGPGLRYVLFTAGCPLQCLYCHNPETRSRECSTVVTAGDALKEIVRYKSFLRRGGLTISGGEPLVQPEFIHAILHGAKEAGIHTALDTSGYYGAKASDALLESVDLVLLDIKSWDSATYRKTTGVEVAPTLEFARRLDRLNKKVWIRFVMVPGLTDAEENMRGLAEFVSTLGNVERLEILPFHKMGEDKYEKLGMTYQLKDTRVPTDQEILAARALFRSYGIEAI